MDYKVLFTKGGKNVAVTFKASSLAECIKIVRILFPEVRGKTIVQLPTKQIEGEL